MRRVLFRLHMWMGIGSGLYVLLVTLSGAGLVFRGEIQRRLYPELFWVMDSRSERIPMAEAVRNLSAAYPDYKILGVEQPTPDRHTFIGYLEKEEDIKAVFVNPITGRVLGTLPDQSFFLWLQDLHFRLLSGRTGLLVNGAGALLLFGLCLTGVFIWWPGISNVRRSMRADFRRNWKRVTWELHGAAGIWAVAMIAMWALTGAYFAFPKPARAVIGYFSPFKTMPAVSSNASLKGYRSPVEVHEFITRAVEAVPGAKLARISLPADDNGAFLVALTRNGIVGGEGEHYVYLYFDQFSGELLQSVNGSARSAGDSIVSWLASLHVGNFGGVPIKVLWVIFGITPAFLFITGVIMWWNRALARAVKPVTVAEMHPR
jgi:uncharacterized iron-regulated membrane protein